LATGVLTAIVALPQLPVAYAPLPLLTGSGTSVVIYSLRLRPLLRRADHTYLGAL
jgi:hypothetical protein